MNEQDEKTGAALIAEERQRQIDVEGYAPADDFGKAHALVDAASCYLRAGTQKPGTVPIGWPWEDRYWKPSTDPERNLVKAGALIAAAIDSLDGLDRLRRLLGVSS